jgi:ribonuclease D
MIDSQQALDDLTARLTAAGEVAVDCEFHGEGRYLQELCLLQLAGGGAVEAVDPQRVDLAPLGPLLADGRVRKLMHAGAQDVAILARATGLPVANVFDTQVAAAFVGYGAQVAYVKLVEKVCGARLSKAARFTDWTRRPLDPQQIAYALDDVRYLGEVARALTAELERRGRLGWAGAACDAAARRAQEPRDPRLLYLRLGPLSNFTPRQLAVLREVAAWRDARARDRDRPLGSIAIDEALRQVAQQPPRDAKELNEIRGLRDVEKGGADLIGAIRRGRELPEAECPSPSRSAADPRVEGAASLLAAALRARARELDLAPSLIANREDVQSLAAWHYAGRPSPGPAIEILSGWQREAAGETLLGLLEGRIAVKLDAGAPEGLALVEL